MEDEEFRDLCDSFRSPHIWKKVGNKWQLRHTPSNDGTDDTPQISETTASSK